MQIMEQNTDWPDFMRIAGEIVKGLEKESWLHAKVLQEILAKEVRNAYSAGFMRGQQLSAKCERCGKTERIYGFPNGLPECASCYFRKYA
jgi:ribosomal protein S27E